MTTAGYVGIGVYVLAALLTGFAMGIQEELSARRRRTAPDGPGLWALTCAIIAPLVWVFAVGYGIVWLLDGGVRRAADRIEGRKRKREQMERRIKQLEAELLEKP